LPPIDLSRSGPPSCSLTPTGSLLCTHLFSDTRSGPSSCSRFGDVASCRGRRGSATSTCVPSLRIRLAGAWLFAPPHRLARRGLGRSLRLTDLLGGDLIIRPASQTCSARIWSFALPHRLARRGLDHMPRLADLLGEDLIICPASQTCST
jgi:hypothetical protein